MPTYVKNHSGRSTNLDGQTNRRSESCEHIDQCIGTKEVDTPPEEITDARLSHAQSLGGRLLLEPTRRNELLYLNHEIRPDQQVFGLLTAKPKVTEHVSGGRYELLFHITHEL